MITFDKAKLSADPDHIIKLFKKTKNVCICASRPSVASVKKYQTLEIGLNISVKVRLVQ